jgi:hypothetical protein
MNSCYNIEGKMGRVTYRPILMMTNYCRGPRRNGYRRAVRGERLALTPERWNCSIRLTFEMTAVHEDSWQVRIRELKGDVNHLGFVWNQWDVLNVLGLVWNR